MEKLDSDFIDHDLYSDFYALVRQIPKGMVSTYGALARALGDVAAARACGYMLSINPDPVGTPCFKVVRSDGTVGKFTHPLGSEEKVRRLRADGTQVDDGRIVDFEGRCFTGFRTTEPLRQMKEEQERMAKQVSLEDNYDLHGLAAVDVSYDDQFGYGAIVMERDGKIEKRHVRMEIEFPYIPGYLSYREFKFIRELAGDYSGVILIDGNGYLHPRRVGLASFTGLMLGVPTIGVAKSLLLGKRQGGWIFNGETRSAYELNKRCIISAGHRISLDSAVSLVVDRYGGKYPTLLKQAHDETVKLRKGLVVI